MIQNNYKKGKNNSRAASVFNETHIFGSEYSFLIYPEKRKKKFEFIWATQNPMNKKNVCQLTIRNTNRFEYYITQQLLNDVNVSRCHTETLSYENMFIPFKYTLLLFSRFYFLGYKYEGHDFLRAGAFVPPELA